MYDFKALQIIETAQCIGTGNDQIRILFEQIKNTIYLRKFPCLVGNMRAHLNLSGPLAKGKESTDRLTKFVALSQVERALQSHNFHHQNSPC